jgi:hypothetical protein
MKALLWGVLFIILVGIGGFIYRNAVSRPPVATGACTADAKICPDGSTLGRMAPDCNFPACPVPNVTLAAPGIVFALPEGYAEDQNALGVDASLIASYGTAPLDPDGPPAQSITIHDYALASSTSAAAIIHSTAIGDASGAPVSPSSFSAAYLGRNTYTMAVVGRFEGVVHVSYYLPRTTDVLRFDAIDQGVLNWSDSSLDLTTLPANKALRALLTTMQPTNSQ